MRRRGVDASLPFSVFAETKKGNMDMHIHMRRPVTVLSIAAVVLSASLIAPLSGSGQTHAAGGVLLRYHWTVGQHFSERATSSQDIAVVFPKVPGASSTSKEIDRYISSYTVTKVFPDGSGLVHIVYSNVSITKDGKTAQYPLKGYALDLKVSTLGDVLSKTTTGKASADLPSDITDPTPIDYPKAAIPVGGSWTRSDTIASLGTMVEHLRLESVGSMQGRQTATLVVTAAVPIWTTMNGMAVKGTLTVSGKQVVFVDVFADAAPVHMTMSLNATIKGPIDGVTMSGTMTISSTEDGIPLS